VTKRSGGRDKASQHTIAETVSCLGTGLHSGVPVHLTLRPAPADSGVVLVRTDRGRSVEIRAHPSAVRSTRLATTLGSGATVGTVEHLFAALFGLGVDNVRVEVDGSELPIMDGSAAPFVYLLRAAGIRAQPAARPVLRLRRPLEVRDGERSIRIEPARSFRVSYAVEFDHPLVGRQQYRLDSFEPEHFEREISPARTFGFLRDVHTLWRSGLARGGSLDNTLVLDEAGVVNRDGLRWPDEFVRHKVLDLLGDLALLGMPIRGHIRVERGGHSLHQQLVAAIVANPDSWRVDGTGSRAPRSLGPTPCATPA
jgi:UDP-3-O-[3-hydroxymyristoyl] N-acetylglucosamine deacetylase